MVGLIVILVGVASVVLGTLVARRAIQSKVGTVSRDGLNPAQLRGAIPSFAPFAVIGGLLAILVGIVLVIVL